MKKQADLSKAYEEKRTESIKNKTFIDHLELLIQYFAFGKSITLLSSRGEIWDKKIPFWILHIFLQITEQGNENSYWKNSLAWRHLKYEIVQSSETNVSSAFFLGKNSNRCSKWSGKRCSGMVITDYSCKYYMHVCCISDISKTEWEKSWCWNIHDRE